MDQTLPSPTKTKECAKCIFSEQRAGWFYCETEVGGHASNIAGCCGVYTTDEDIAQAWPIEGKGGGSEWRKLSN